MIASRVPNVSPITIDATVSSSVRDSPARICGSNKYSATTGHSNAGLVATLNTTPPATNSETTLAAQVQGWRSGTTRSAVTSGRFAGSTARS